MTETKGQYRVGVTFNPSQNRDVDLLKRMAADFIDVVEEIAAEDGEVGRLKALAQTEMESAAMWAVKAATKQKRQVDDKS